MTSAGNSAWKCTRVWKKFSSVQVSINETVRMKSSGTSLEKSASDLFSNFAELGTVTVLHLKVAYNICIFLSTPHLKLYIIKNKQTNKNATKNSSSFLSKHLIVPK